MRKKFLAVTMTLGMMLFAAACGKEDNDAASQESSETVSVEESKPAQSQPAEESKEPESSAQVSGDTVGSMIQADFRKIMSENDGMSSEEIASKLCENEALVINPLPMPVEPGYLTGFGNVEINGFSDGTMFAPMIGSIPFVGYVFVLEDGQDADAFISNLKSNADLRWLVCDSADEMVADKAGNVVLFVMCTTTFER